MKGFWETGGLRKEEEVQEREIFGRAEESRSRKGRNAAGSASALSDFRNAHFPGAPKDPRGDAARSEALPFSVLRLIPGGPAASAFSGVQQKREGEV